MKRLSSILLALALLAAPAAAQATMDSGAAWSAGMANYPTIASHAFSAASTNSTSVRAGSGVVYNIVATNTAGSTYYLKLYDKATAPTCNSDTVMATFPITAGSTLNLMAPAGIAFRLGIGWCLTGGLADNDNTNAATGVAVNLLYK